MLNRSKKYFEKADLDLQGKYLFVGQANSFFADAPGVNTHFEAIKNFETILETRKGSGLKWRYQYYDDNNHGSVAFIAEYDALRFLFEGYYASFSKIRNVGELKTQYQNFSKETKVNFLPPEKVVREVANIPLFFNKNDLVQEYYQLNIDNYPKSPTAFENMGQLWLKKGDKKRALEYYEKSLKLNPLNKDVEKQIIDLKKETGK